MNKTKRVTITAVGIIGFLLYFKRDIHRWYYVNIQKQPIETYDPEPVNKLLWML